MYGEDWLAGSHGGGGISSGMNDCFHPDINAKTERMKTQCGSVGQSQLGAVALLKAV